MKKARGKSTYRTAVQRLGELEPGEASANEIVRCLGAVIDEVPQLSSHSWEILMAMESVIEAPDAVAAMAGGPADLVADIARENLLRAAAHRQILSEPMMEADVVAQALGSRSVNPGQYASLRRRRSELLGVPVANRYLFPAFQIDLERRRTYPTVVEVNLLLDAAHDPWGVASWWFSRSARLGGVRPADVVADEGRIEDVLRVAHAVVGPIG